MDTQAADRSDSEIPDDGVYLRRAQALLASRGELFMVSVRSVRLAGIAGPPQDRTAPAPRRGGRQLTLPIPREHRRRRARMVG